MARRSVDDVQGQGWTRIREIKSSGKFICMILSIKYPEAFIFGKNPANVNSRAVEYLTFYQIGSPMRFQRSKYSKIYSRDDISL